jgi:hypothetical protein
LNWFTITNIPKQFKIKDRKDRMDEKMRRKTYTTIGFPSRKGGYWKLEEEALDHTLWRTRFA